MEQQTRGERHGFLRVLTKDSVYIFRRAEFEALMTAWREHRLGNRTDPIYEGEDNYGVTVCLDLAAIEGVLDWTPAAIAAQHEDEQLEKLRDGD